ncbi:hypothetical protein BS50DRAFT_257949 [Corynespora cassiicola Philippines]|uniref:Uncharacterized protein n=1 Tax=Corynespora cassiicola Philippines TaxID=1448308 RepID=A0A2T2N2P7_CORCC|nr:hypothetical protein BS50DRAFT_257949 [Corynespora cassiicola Philippines]
MPSSLFICRCSSWITSRARVWKSLGSVTDTIDSSELRTATLLSNALVSAVKKWELTSHAGRRYPASTATSLSCISTSLLRNSLTLPVFASVVPKNSLNNDQTIALPRWRLRSLRSAIACEGSSMSSLWSDDLVVPSQAVWRMPMAFRQSRLNFVDTV